jgi:3-phosphoshikimate 1-carboxyvinyltransferase
MGGLEDWQPYHSAIGRETTGGSIPIQPQDITAPIQWQLAPSKSHMIRWLLLASQGEKDVTLNFSGTPGDDVESMARCLSQLGVNIEKSESQWVISGVGVNGFKRPISVLNCGNSGTALRLLTIATARLNHPIMLDGDQTLRRRHSETLLHILEYLGAQVSHGTGLESLPYLVHGPMKSGEVTIDVSRSSQPLSSLLLSMPALDGEIRVNLAGQGVSRLHAQLSFELAEKTGSENQMDWRKHINLKPWIVECPDVVEIPSDRSLESFAILYQSVHGIEVEVTNLPSDDDSLGAEILATCAGGQMMSDIDDFKIDLRDSNDLVPPLAAILAIGNGGTITGASHARHKESNRIEKTSELLAQFGLTATPTEDGLKIEGGQTPTAPSELVKTHADHRLWMTAACLATKVGATLSHPNCYAVSDPDFINKL